VTVCDFELHLASKTELLMFVRNTEVIIREVLRRSSQGMEAVQTGPGRHWQQATTSLTPLASSSS
jgi:hypothetical protein